MNIREYLENKAPWLVKDFNGAIWEDKQRQLTRRVKALESHIVNLEDRFADIENRLLDHAQGQKHRKSKDKLPEADKE